VVIAAPAYAAAGSFPRWTRTVGAPRRDSLFSDHGGGAGYGKATMAIPRRFRLPHPAREKRKISGRCGLERLPEPGAGGKALLRVMVGGCVRLRLRYFPSGAARLVREELGSISGSPPSRSREDVLPRPGNTAISRRPREAAGADRRALEGLPGFTSQQRYRASP